MTGDLLLRESARYGLRLSRRGTKLVVSPVSRCPPALLQLLKQHKSELMEALEAAGLAEDERPWIHIARQVLEGEFGGADTSTPESLMIGLRNIEHPTCRAAFERLAAANKAK